MKKLIEVPSDLTFEKTDDHIRKEIADKVVWFFTYFCNEDDEKPNTTKSVHVVIKSVLSGGNAKWAGEKIFAAGTSKEEIVKTIEMHAIEARRKNGRDIFLEMDAF